MTDDCTEKFTDDSWEAIELRVSERDHGARIDKVLALHSPNISRSRLQAAIRQADILLNDKPVDTKHKVQYGDLIRGGVRIEPIISHQPEEIDLNIVYEDDYLLVINKPAGLVVHPGAGNANGTVLNALLHHVPSTETLPRAGIVHRLDKDTTGLMAVAKTHDTQLALINQLQARSVSRSYNALVYGEFISGGTIELPIGRDPRDRVKMKVNRAGKEAITHYQIEERFNGITLLTVRLETGRTHQIRVHMSHLKHPLVGDKTYGRPTPPKGISSALRQQLLSFPRQCLHAKALSFTHPTTDQIVSFSAPLPMDYLNLLDELRIEVDEEVEDLNDFWHDPAYSDEGEIIDED